jgi:hypothetical protein
MGPKIVHVHSICHGKGIHFLYHIVLIDKVWGCL